MAADAYEGRDGFSAVGPGAIHRRGSRTTSKPPEEPSWSSRERLYLPCKAVGDGFPFLDALPLDARTLFGSPPLIGYALALDR
jgi:hypothetical protein